MGPILVGKVAEAYTCMRLLQHGLIPCVPLIDCQGFDVLVRIPDGRYVRLQVKSRGEALPDGYGNQIKKLWWSETEKSLAFDYLVIVLTLDGREGREAWVIPVDKVRPHVSEGGDITLSPELLDEEWKRYEEQWSLD